MSVKEENMMRTLADKPLIVSSWLCRFGWHTWTRWSKEYKSNSYFYQSASCVHCNKLKVHKLEDQNRSTV